MNFLNKVKTVWKCRNELWLEKKIRIDFIAFQRKWRELNSHNSTVAGCKFDLEKVKVGDKTYGTLNIHCWDNPMERIEIGSFCSIAEDVNFILGGVHPIDRVTTFPYISHVLGVAGLEPTGTKGAIVVEDDVWICYGATILSGVRIGRGSVIAAKAVVTRDIPPYSIVINGEIARQRFSDNVIKKLVQIDLHKIANILDDEKKEEMLFTEITDENIDKVIFGLL